MFFPFTSLRKPTARPPILLWLVWVVLIVPCVLSGSVNRTIDDTFGDSVTGQLPTLGPNGWPDNFCGVFALLTSGCGTGNWAPNTADPDMFNHTYHFAYSDSNYLSLQFTGTAIYVYTIVINSAQHNIGPEAAFGGAGVSAEMDGGPSEVVNGELGAFSVLPAYNVLLYSKTGLANTSHSLTIKPLASQILFFDYAVYTFEDSDSSSSSGASGSSSGSSSSRSMSLGLSPSSQTTRPAASAASGSVSPSAVSSSAPATIATVKKKKNLAGLIAGTVIAGLVLLGAIALFFYFVARRRGTAAATPHFGSEVDEKRPAFWPEHPIPRNLTPTAGFIYTSWEPDTWSQMAGSPRLSYTTADRLPVPPSPLAETSLPVEGKNVLYQARQEEAGRQVELLEQQIRDLTEQARPSLPSESMNASTPRQPPDSGANSQLVAQIRALRRQIDAIHNEMQISELPEYAAADPESMFIN